MRLKLELRCPYCGREREHDTGTEIPHEKLDCESCDAVDDIRVHSVNRGVYVHHIEWSPSNV
jgi:hypothetical protein